MRQLFLIIFLAIIVFFQINGEKIPVNDGAFGDGVFYREVGQTFLESIEQQGYNLIQITRILPFALLNLSFSAFHIVKDLEGMKNGMIIWQLIYLSLSVYWYFKICKKIRAKTPIMTLGFILMFINFTWLKDFWYHPFSPDSAAFALGMGQTNYYLRYEKLKLGLVSVLGVFVTPLLLVSGLLMLFLPGDKLTFYPAERPKSAFSPLLALGVIALLAALGWGVWNWGESDWHVQLIYGLSLASLFPLFILVARQNPIDWENSWIMLKKRTKSDRLNKGIMALAGVLMILFLLSGNNEVLGLRKLVKEIGNGVFRFPLDFLLGLGLQWGVAVFLTGIYLHRFVEELGKEGWAAVFALLIGLMILPFFGSLSLAAWVPLWIITLLKSIKRYHWGNKDLILMGLFGLFLSLFWLPINSPILEAWLANPQMTASSSFDIQKLAMHWEAFRSWSSYLVLVFCFALIGYFFQLRRKKYQRVILD